MMIVIELQETIFFKEIQNSQNFYPEFFFNNPNFSISKSPDFQLSNLI